MNRIRLPKIELILVFLAVVLCLSNVSFGTDWPTHQGNNRRTGYSPDKVLAAELGIESTWRSSFVPQPAWAGPAKWDAYAGRKGLPSMRSYDLVFHPIVANGRVFFGSSADDTLRSLDPKTGSEARLFTADAPIRVAPTFHGDRLYFGSDDGCAYCVSATNGELFWKIPPPEDAPRILNNGRFISKHPCRTGVLLDNGLAYFGNALLPWDDAWITCVDAATAKIVYRKKVRGLTLEGPLAASSTLLISPQGRVAPRVFNRADGKDLGNMKKSGGGSVVVVSLDAGILHGPAANPRTGAFAASSTKSLEMLAGFGKGNALVVRGRLSYQLTDTEIIASDLVSRKVVWRVPCDLPNSLIGSGDYLFAGGADRVAAFRIKDGKQVWESPVEGRVYGMAAADGRIAVSTDAGVMHSVSRLDKGRGDTGSSEQTTATKPDNSLTTKNAANNPENAENNPAKKVKLIPIDAVVDPKLVGHWVFQSPHVEGTHITGLNNKLAFDTAKPLHLEQTGPHQAAMLDAANTARLMIRKDYKQATLPTKSISAAAWVRVDQPLTWGGIVGAFNDDGSYERGWLLGYRNSRFSMAIAAKDGGGKLTYLTAPADSQLEAWHHVAGTYDGETTKLFVDGKLVASTQIQKGDINYPPNAFFEIGAYHDKNEDFRMSGQLHEVRVYGRVLSDAEIAVQFQEKASRFVVPVKAKPDVAQLAVGPSLRFTSPETATVTWETNSSSPTELQLTLDEKSRTFRDKRPKTLHEVKLGGLKRDRQYSYTIHVQSDGQHRTSPVFECDTFFNYTFMSHSLASLSSADVVAPPVDNSQLARVAQSLKLKSGIQDGLCLLLGLAPEPGRLAAELARQSRLRLVVVDTDASKVATARKRLADEGLYGGRVTVLKVETLDVLPLVGRCANLIVAGSWLDSAKCRGSATEVLRMLRPDGGVAMFGQPSGGQLSAAMIRAWTASSDSGWKIEASPQGTWAAYERGPLAGAGEWSHLYGSSNNTAFGGEELGGIRQTSLLDVQWIGRPGPRYQADRNGRKPSPLATGGRLFMQGLNRIVAVDAFNGVLLWSLELPAFLRCNMPRDCGNWCADREAVFAAVKDKCWKIDATTGRVTRRFNVVPAEIGDQTTNRFDWGYVANTDTLLVGSAVKQGTSWTEFWGKATAGWYDAAGGAVTHKVCSDSVFALDKDSGQLHWKYSGLVINPSITITGNQIVFAECRSPGVKATSTRRVDTAALWSDLHLVSLHLETGKIHWQVPLKVKPATVVFYLAASGEKLVSVGSGSGRYHVDCFSTTDGKPLWTQSFPWPGGKSDHGKAMSRPAIVNNKVFVRPRVLDLATGRLLPETLPGGGCGTYACSSNALFFRAKTITIWDATSHETSTWSRLRPDCWLSTIPANGMLLSPEGGGGCSCGGWLETSIGFIPRAH